MLGVLFVAFIIRSFMGIDASKEDPHELFMVYVQRPIPPEISVQSAVGHANFGGTCITFRLKITGSGLDELIAEKRLHKTDSLQEYTFPDKDLASMKQPEFYYTSEDMTWSELGTVVNMAADRNTGVAFYMVFGP